MYMASISFLLAFLFIILIVPFSKASKFPSLLSLACTPPSNTSLMNRKSIKTLLDGIASSMANYSAFNLTTAHYNGVMQCLPDLTSDLCAFCASNAKQAIQSFCPNASSVTAWFDGCYLRYYSHANNLDKPAIFSCSSNHTTFQNRVHFELILESLLLRLRADIYLTTHQRFSTGHIAYSNGSRIYAIVKCVESLSPEECGVCIGKGIERVYEHCGGKEGGTVANEYCIVRYESYKFFSNINGSSDGIVSGGALAVGEGSRGQNKFQLKVGLLLWGIGVICFVVVVISAWLLKRSVINKAKVAAFGNIDHGNPDRERCNDTF